MEELARKSYRHGNVPNAMRAAARAILDDEGGAHAVGLREAARRIGVSPTAAYRHFSSKEDLLASVAAEGFRELSAALDRAMQGPDHLLGLGLAYVEFALQKRGLFRLMLDRSWPSVENIHASRKPRPTLSALCRPHKQPTGATRTTNKTRWRPGALSTGCFAFYRWIRPRRSHPFAGGKDHHDVRRGEAGIPIGRGRDVTGRSDRRGCPGGVRWAANVVAGPLPFERPGAIGVDTRARRRRPRLLSEAAVEEGRYIGEVGVLRARRGKRCEREA